MKKIVTVTKKMTMGGCEKALVPMLKVLPINKYKVTLLVMAMVVNFIRISENG